MMFAKKCPKCGGNVQTKTIKKSIGLGMVDIPVAQFCLNPVCDWYQDFTDSKKPEDIKEDVLQIRVPQLKKLPGIAKTGFSLNYYIVFGIIIAVFAILLLLNFMTQPSPIRPESPTIGPAENPPANIIVSSTPGISTMTPVVVPVLKEKILPVAVRMDTSHGFNPRIMIINVSESIIWINEESQRTRVYFISKDNLFEKKLMQNTDRFSFQFNISGNYSFALAEFPSMNEYPNTTGIVIVK